MEISKSSWHYRLLKKIYGEVPSIKVSYFALLALILFFGGYFLGGLIFNTLSTSLLLIASISLAIFINWWIKILPKILSWPSKQKMCEPIKFID